jgi:hypothetical protein
MNLWDLTGASWPLSRKFLVVDVGMDALTQPADTLVKMLQTQGGAGLIAATQPRGVQCVLFENGQGTYAKFSAHPREFWVYYQCADGWCRVKTPTCDIPLKRVKVLSIAPQRQPLLIGPIGPCPQSIDRVGACSLRTMAMLYLTEIYLQNRVFYWKDLHVPDFKRVDFGTVENYFGDMPKMRPVLLTVNFAAVLVGEDKVVQYFDPVLDTQTMRALAWHADRAGLEFKAVNSKIKPLEDVYWFVAGKRVANLLDLARLCFEKKVTPS